MRSRGPEDRRRRSAATIFPGNRRSKESALGQPVDGVVDEQHLLVIEQRARLSCVSSRKSMQSPIVLAAIGRGLNRPA